MIPYVMGYPPDSVKQTALYRYKAIYLSEIRIQLERNAIHYWMIACDFEQDFESNTTLFLPRPFGHDKFQFTAFNAQITPPDFIRDYQIYSDQFMHAYQVVDTLFVQAFLALSPAEKWLSVRKNKLYIFLPKKQITYHVNELDIVISAVKEEAKEALNLAHKVAKLTKKQ